jgi:hypothetical protein
LRGGTRWASAQAAGSLLAGAWLSTPLAKNKLSYSDAAHCKLWWFKGVVKKLQKERAIFIFLDQLFTF